MNLPTFDVLSLIDGWIGQSQYGQMHRFVWDAGSGFTGYRVESMLRQYGVRVWGRKAQGDKRSFLVRRNQAVWAEYLICRMGVPLESKLLDQRNLTYANAHPDTMPSPWDKDGIGPISFVDRLAEMLARLVG